MADDWLKMRLNLWTHPKVVTLASRMCPRNVRETSESVTQASVMCLAIGSLCRAWSVADEHADENGRVMMTANALDDIVGTPGFASHMQFIGWLNIEPDSLQFVNYQQHNGATAKKRAEDSLRKRMSRMCPRNVRETSAESVTREEKRRVEEKSNTPPTPQRGRRVRNLPEYTEDFLRFWEAYPRKVDKADAFQSWRRVGADADLQQTILTVLEQHKRSRQWTSGDVEKIPLPTTWLNKRRWESDITSGNQRGTDGYFDGILNGGP